uniref:hypothetical protein n=1 Tax=Algoriphagus sp. TaxID=1872435 RepID=UPI00258E903D|nr:hypothetical protein [Algoriphagus sp.]
MIKQLEETLDTIELLRIIISEYRSDHAKCLCPLSRQRIAWDWHKAVCLYKKRQKEALELADQLIPDLNSIIL